MKLVYDVKLKRPGCAILQAVFGGDQHLAGRFPSETWLTDITPDLKLYEVTEEQLEWLIKVGRIMMWW